jgi:hypothetical protein
VTIEQYNLFKAFFNQINESIQLIKNLLRIEINIKLFSNINFLSILLFDKNQNSSLSKFIDEFSFDDKFGIIQPEKLQLSSNNSLKLIKKHVDDDDGEERSSQYSTLSSILGFQVYYFL